MLHRFFSGKTYTGEDLPWVLNQQDKQSKFKKILESKTKLSEEEFVHLLCIFLAEAKISSLFLSKLVDAKAYSRMDALRVIHKYGSDYEKDLVDHYIARQMDEIIFLIRNALGKSDEQKKGDVKIGDIENEMKHLLKQYVSPSILSSIYKNIVENEFLRKQDFLYFVKGFGTKEQREWAQNPPSGIFDICRSCRRKP